MHSFKILALITNRTMINTNKLRTVKTGITMRRTITSGGSKKSDDKPHITMKHLKSNLAESVGLDQRFQTIGLQQKRQDLNEFLAKSQNDLPARSMRDSFLAAYIPLSTDTELQEKYTTFLGTVRVGRLLEDMDFFAVIVAKKHISLPNLPPGTPWPIAFVTALADRIEFTGYSPKLNQDIKVSGHVGWVGKSSMEVVVWLEQEQHSIWHLITKASFVIAARDTSHTKGAIVNPIIPADDREKAIFNGGETRKERRMALMKSHVSRIMPDQDEQKVIHDLYLRTRSDSDPMSLRSTELPVGAVWMEKCKLSNAIFSQPENRNMNNTVFGGFIMRQAHELSWILGYQFSKYRPKIKSISDINFTKPIAVNSLIHMYAYVVYTHMQYIQITVYVYTFDPNTGKTDTTNTVHFTYEIPELTKEVFPRTYQEAMMHIDGRRHFFEIMKPQDDFNLNDEEDNFNSKL